MPSLVGEPSTTAVRMVAGLLSRFPGPAPACETDPKSVAGTTWSRWPAMVRIGPLRRIAAGTSRSRARDVGRSALPPHQEQDEKDDQYQDKSSYADIH
ncbi:MAG: hypothetical protein HOW97_32240 [Catenulispora sp.]|nr:hypothetical protein [Catenulispora sp.]